MRQLQRVIKPEEIRFINKVKNGAPTFDSKMRKLKLTQFASCDA